MRNCAGISQHDRIKDLGVTGGKLKDGRHPWRGAKAINNIFMVMEKTGHCVQVQDDYLDAFGDPQKFGKQVGGDILANKKTFLMIHALEVAEGSRKKS
jgi:hypothetical protein